MPRVARFRPAQIEEPVPSHLRAASCSMPLRCPCGNGECEEWNVRRIGLLMVALCLLLSTGCATSESTEDFQAIDNHQSAEATLAAIMHRFEHGDVSAVKQVMTGHLIVNEEADGGFLQDPPKIVSYTMVGSSAPPPAGGAAAGYQEAVALNVQYKTEGGPQRYEGDYDTWTFVKSGNQWILAEIMGMGGP